MSWPCRARPFAARSADLEITVPLLVQIDRLVHILESPVFTREKRALSRSRARSHPRWPQRCGPRLTRPCVRARARAQI